MVEVTTGGGITRREFRYHAWGASIALLAVETAGLRIWFVQPLFRAGQFGGQFTVSVDAGPQINGPPIIFLRGRFWLVNRDTTSDRGTERMYLASEGEEPIVGVAAIYKAFAHLGCIYDWNQVNERFECPCHGSKYRLHRRRIEDPAPRSCDRFLVAAVDESETVLAVAEVGTDGTYAPLRLPSGTALSQVDTGALLKGPSKTSICELHSNGLIRLLGDISSRILASSEAADFNMDVGAARRTGIS